MKTCLTLATLALLMGGTAALAEETHTAALAAPVEPAAAPAHNAAHAAAPHWGYDGEASPADWGQLSPDWAACGTGTEQSPIDIVPAAAISAEVPDVELHWQPFAPSIINNGHTIQANTDGAGGYVTLGGVRYDLLQFHFHHQSEHTIDGKHAPMEVHFVHKSEAGDLLVLGVMLEAGAENVALAKLWEKAPGIDEQAALAEPVDFSTLLPGDRAAFRYAGSLTTPPCSEIVTWNVFSTPVTLSDSQINAFAAMYPNDFRPVQPLNRRFVLSSR